MLLVIWTFSKNIFHRITRVFLLVTIAQHCTESHYMHTADFKMWMKLQCAPTSCEFCWILIFETFFEMLLLLSCTFRENN